GTPAFAAPEQLLGEVQGPAADYFALAAIVVYALTGAPPFGDDDAKSILARQLGERAKLGSLPAPICTWLQTALAPDPADRFDDGVAMKEAWGTAAEKAMARERGGWWRRVVGP
ncbi:MAG TPA: hypothetical protein VNJ04_19855, partial [Gemmatimonadaceae bacterium]|nr:hypothetical protein [Gemmatimonadaceae bacterium]